MSVLFIVFGFIMLFASFFAAINGHHEYTGYRPDVAEVWTLFAFAGFAGVVGPILIMFGILLERLDRMIELTENSQNGIPVWAIKKPELTPSPKPVDSNGDQQASGQ